MKLRFIFLILLLATIFIQCSGPKKVTAVKSETKPLKLVSYATDIKPILLKHCTPCHFPETGKKKFLDTYQSARDNIMDIIARVQLNRSDEKFMPFKLKKEPLSDSLITILKTWRSSGMTE